MGLTRAHLSPKIRDMTTTHDTTTDWTIAEMSNIPTCDICGLAKATVDAATKMDGNPWAYMCDDCWETDGRTPGKLGLGIGQRLITLKKGN